MHACVWGGGAAVSKPHGGVEVSWSRRGDLSLLCSAQLDEQDATSLLAEA